MGENRSSALRNYKKEFTSSTYDHQYSISDYCFGAARIHLRLLLRGIAFLRIVYMRLHTLLKLYT